MLLHPMLAACAAVGNPGLLLDRFRRVAGTSRPLSGTTDTLYSYQGQGLTGEVRVVVDAGSDRYRREQRAGIVAEAEGFDGRTAWLRDMSGFAKPQEAGDRRALAINEVYRLGNRWWRPDHGGARLGPIGCGGVRITPPGGKPFEAWFAAKSGLLAKVREVRSFGTPVETVYAAYARRSGMLLPTHVAVTYGDDPASRETLIVQHVSRSRDTREIAFAVPPRNPRDWSLPVAGRTVIPFRLINNHVIVDAAVDGKGPFPFLVDTGGHNILTPRAVTALGLDVEGATSSSGAGEKTVESGYVRVGRVEAGGARLDGPVMLTLDFSPPDVEGIALYGMLGAEFLERFVVQLDYGARTMTLIDPARFLASDRAQAGTPVPVDFYVHMPQVAGRIDGRPARLNIDTGARDELTLTSPFVAAGGLRDAYPNGVVVTTGWGVGGPSRTYAARAGNVSLGPVTVARPVIGLSAATRGSFADAAYDANVGSGLLKRFVATFDYADRILFLKPLAILDPDVGQFDRVGLWLNLGADGLKVMDVVPGSPAAEAGLRVGDTILAIGEIAYDQRSLSDTRRALKLAEQPLELRYRRGTQVGRVEVVPRAVVSD